MITLRLLLLLPLYNLQLQFFMFHSQLLFYLYIYWFIYFVYVFLYQFLFKISFSGHKLTRRLFLAKSYFQACGRFVYQLFHIISSFVALSFNNILRKQKGIETNLLCLQHYLVMIVLSHAVFCWRCNQTTIRSGNISCDQYHITLPLFLLSLLHRRHWSLLFTVNVKVSLIFEASLLYQWSWKLLKLNKARNIE